MKLELYKDRRGKHRWRVRAHNGLIMADSGQGYARKCDCVRGAVRVGRVLVEVER